MGIPMKRMRTDVNPSMKRTLVPLSGPTINTETPKVQQIQQVPKSVPSTAGVQTYGIEKTVLIYLTLRITFH